MKKVLFLVNHDLVIYNFRKELVEHLLQEGFVVYISSPYGERINEMTTLGCHFIDTKIARHGTSASEDIKLYNHYKKIIKKIKPDIVLSYTIKPNIYGAMACKKLNVPCIANITGLGTAVESESLIQKLILRLYKLAFKKIDCVFFQNEENMQFFLDKKLIKSKYELIPGSGVNLNHFEVLNYPDNAVIRFVFISRIMKEKGIDQFLEAAEIIRLRHPYTRFDVCGFCEENYEKKLKNFQDRDIIKYHGMIRDVRTVLKISHCTLHPSYYPEGMSNVLLESAACGRPVITTNRSGCREIVDVGYNGFLVIPQNTEDLIEKIEVFLKLSYAEKKRMGLASRKKIEKEFDREIIVNAYMKEIRSLLTSI